MSETMGGRKHRVCVVGAGVSGLPAIKACLDEGLDVVCYERTSAIGGLWNYRPGESNVGATVMASTVVNTSKEMMAYSIFPPPPGFPNFMHHSLVQRYLTMYAAHFDLLTNVRFGVEVKRVVPISFGKSSSAEDDDLCPHRWMVILSSGETERFDAVMICTGHHSSPNMPEINGLHRFKGDIFHSHDYRNSAGFEHKSVLVVGIGNSGLDIAVELARAAKNVVLSTRRGSWIFNRVGQNGIPYDVVLQTRLYQGFMQLLPWTVSNDFMEYRVQQRMDHELYGLKPSHRFLQQHPAVNDSLANLICSGQITIADDIEEVREQTVLFCDKRELHFDALVLCTGYKFGFPFVDVPELRGVEGNELDLFKFVFPPNIPELAVIGLIQPIGSVSPIAEMQSRWAAGVFSGRLKHTIPSSNAMHADIEAKRRRIRRQYFRSQKHTVQVDFIAYMDELAELVGCRPPLLKILWSDPSLALRLFLGPNVPYVYRLCGPGAWPEARRAIFTVPDRVRCPLRGSVCWKKKMAVGHQRAQRRGILDHHFRYATAKCLALYLFILFFAGLALFVGTSPTSTVAGLAGRALAYSTFAVLLGIVLTMAHLFNSDFTWL